MKWSLDDLKKYLKQLVVEKKIINWVFEESKNWREEYYLIQSAGQMFQGGSSRGVELDQSRSVYQQEIEVTLYVNKGQNLQGKGRVLFNTQKDYKEQVDLLITEANVSSERRWEFPNGESKKGAIVETAYGPLIDDFKNVSAKIFNQLKESINENSASEFNSAELFIIKSETNIWASNGHEDKTQGTKIYTEVCYSSRNEKGDSEEFNQSQWSAHPEQINFSQLCRLSTEGAIASLTTEAPKAGTYSVLVGKDVASQLFSDLAGQMMASRKYNSLSHKKIDDYLIEGFVGTHFKLSLNPHFSYGFSTQAKDKLGHLLEPLILAEENKVFNHGTSPQMAQYLGTRANGYIGNIIVEPEFSTPLDELRICEDQVLEILQFSALFTNLSNLTFSSEIRLAKLWDRKTGKTKYIKGGNLSGSIAENFKNIRFSKECDVFSTQDFMIGANTYFGPVGLLLNDVQVSS